MHSCHMIIEEDINLFPSHRFAHLYRSTSTGMMILENEREVRAISATPTFCLLMLYAL